jgi:hypothetical protein
MVMLYLKKPLSTVDLAQQWLEGGLAITPLISTRLASAPSREYGGAVNKIPPASSIAFEYT